MESLGISHQTLKEFIDKPFGTPNNSKNLKYEERYQAYKKGNKIRIESSIEFEKNYFVHLKVPSESKNKEIIYDVVIQFFTVNKEHENELYVENYYVQFFSNSPGFIYKYAALYKLEGYLIESLMDKFDKGALSVLPDKANKNYELFYDSTIYFACRYLLDTKFFALGKLNLKLFKKKTPERFFADISSIDEMNVNRDVAKLQTEIRKEIQKDNSLSLKQEQNLKKNKQITKNVLAKKEAIRAKHTTYKDTSGNVQRVNSVKRVAPKKKITASKQTRKH